MSEHFLLGIALAASVFNASAADVFAREGNSAYVQDGRGVVVRSGSGLCWRAGYWTPAAAVAGCDGELAPPVARPIAPAIVQPPVVEAPLPAPTRLALQRCDFTVTLVSDETFGFDRAVLNAAARKRLQQDVLARLQQCGRVESVTVTGHADRLGSPAYNRKLSEQRAVAVATYLSNQGLDARLLKTVGAGDSEAVQACDDKLKRAQLVRCLAPNRRVVIVVSGTGK